MYSVTFKTYLFFFFFLYHRIEKSAGLVDLRGKDSICQQKSKTLKQMASTIRQYGKEKVLLIDLLFLLVSRKERTLSFQYICLSKHYP